MSWKGLCSGNFSKRAGNHPSFNTAADTCTKYGTFLIGGFEPERFPFHSIKI
jgi:hypothetical protein